MRLKHDEVVARLKGYGLKFKMYSVYTEGHYTPEDGIWNYKDAMAHIPYIHHLVENVPVHNHKDSLSSLFIQKIFGLRVPIVVYDYEAEKHTQTALTTLFFFVMVIHNVCEEVSPGTTRVTTYYNIGATRPFHWFIPLVGWVLKRNYKVLTSTDIPLRERRGILRDWGYEFRESDYITAEDIRNDNVMAGERVRVPAKGTLDLRAVKDGESLLWGDRSDHYGLRVTRQQDVFLVHPRLCPHEGAALDSAPCKSGNLLCEWHGRALRPLAKIALNSGAQRLELPSHLLEFADGQLSIRPVPGQKAQPVSVQTAPA